MKIPIKDGAHNIAGYHVMVKNGYITQCFLWNVLEQQHNIGYFYEKDSTGSGYTNVVYTPAQFRARVKSDTLIIR